MNFSKSVYGEKTMEYFPYRNIYALVSAVSAKKSNKTDYRYHMFLYLNQHGGISLTRIKVIYCIIVPCN